MLVSFCGESMFAVRDRCTGKFQQEP